jgi:transcriptional regulator with XRE-family HTH domain
MHIGLKIKLARIAKGLTQQDLADKIFKTRPLVSHIEQTGNVNSKTLEEIKKVLDMQEELGNELNEPGVLYEGNGTVQRSIFVQQELEHALREIELIKSELDTLRQLADTQKQLIELLQKRENI